jgi:hypothetical protein
MFNVVDRRRQRALANRDDASCHFLWRQSVIAPYDRHNGNIYLWINILGRLDAGARAQPQHEQRHDDESVWALERKSYDPHLFLISF